MKVIAIVTLCLAICCELQALPSGGCSKKHEDLLKQAVSVKKECGEAEVYDCCAAGTMFNVFGGYYKSPIYEVHSACEGFRNPFQSSRSQAVRCDTVSDNGGWLVILRRDKSLDSSKYVDFDRTWTEYEDGFGDLETEFWYGLREMHCLTQEDVDMRLDITFTNGTSIVWTYGSFKVDGPETNYRLRIGEAVGSPGTHGESMIYYNQSVFTTKDRDNDARSGTNCATWSATGGGWWWNNCGNTFLTRPHSAGNGMHWYNGRTSIPVSFVEMKIRPKTCQVTQESCS